MSQRDCSFLVVTAFTRGVQSGGRGVGESVLVPVITCVAAAKQAPPLSFGGAGLKPPPPPVKSPLWERCHSAAGAAYRRSPTESDR